ncbi:MAG: Ribosomal protein [Thermoleophilia bacterium]|nr:Ribosomal protein [Thermoleophilia bacterium]
MKKREFEDLRKKDISELEKLLVAKRSEVMNFRFSLATGALEDPTKLGQAKRDIARILTLIGDKQRAATAAEVPA